MKSKVFKVILFIIGFIAAERVAYFSTSGFMVTKIATCQKEPDLTFRAAPPKQNEWNHFLTTLDRPYRFLGKGNECFVFASEDGTTVIKFFKHQLTRKSYFKTAYFYLGQTPILNGMRSARALRLRRTFVSTKIAYEHFKKQTGLIASNLARELTTGKTITLIDRLNIKHIFPLDTTEYVVQKWATVARKIFDAHKKAGDMEGAKKRIESIVQSVYHHTMQGYFDRDPHPLTNFGFIGDDVIEIDVGSYFPRDPGMNLDDYKEQFWCDVDRMQRWVDKDFPELKQPIFAYAKQLMEKGR